MVSECDGGLYDTRKPNWANVPLRPAYRYHFGAIKSLADVKATLRAGAFAWPGGYPLYFITHDCAALCFDCARKEFRQIAWDFLNETSTGWRIEACEVNYESLIYCAHCSKQIESAYGVADETEGA